MLFDFWLWTEFVVLCSVAAVIIGDTVHTWSPDSAELSYLNMFSLCLHIIN